MNCIERKGEKIETYAQNGKKVIFENISGSSYERGKVDGCLITDQGVKKCDFFHRDNNNIWFIELKGRHVGEACEQIASSTRVLKKEVGERTVKAVIIVSRCPAISSHQRELRKLHNCVGGAPSLILKTCLATIKF